MPTTTITIKMIDPPTPAKRRGSIVGTDGQRLGVFAEQAKLFEPGKSYDVEYTEVPYGDRTLKNVKSAVEVFNRQPAASPAAEAKPAASSFVNKDKQIFVCALLKEFIAAGKVELDPRSLADATNMLKRLYDYAFEERNTFTSGAARVAHG